MGDRLYVSWYETGLQVFDVSQPSRPIHLGRFDTDNLFGVFPLPDSNHVAISDRNDGLYIVDVSDVLDSPQSDFNEDGMIGIEDIDLLVAAVSQESTDPRLDLNTDGSVDVGDIAPTDIEVVSYAWMGAIYGVIIRWVYTGEPETQRIMDSLLPVLLRSVGFERKEHRAS